MSGSFGVSTNTAASSVSQAMGSMNSFARTPAFVTPPGSQLQQRLSSANAGKIEPNHQPKINPLISADVDAADPRLPQDNGFSATALKAGNSDNEDFLSKLGLNFNANRNNNNKDPKVTFDDVAGVDEAKRELMEVVEFLKDPELFAHYGAEMPTGVLLEGPPGTGKTLLAKAVAGEAGVPIIVKSGPEFVEMFVGLGAKRVRDTFKEATRVSPCVVFIDEIDAVGKSRANGFEGDSGERAQTLNQLLTEMDGFNSDSKIVVLAATNRADVLDDALLRPGRFDRKVTVGLPVTAGREAILEVHSRGKPLAEDFDYEMIARRTPGFSGAQLKNLMNEAAIRAAREKAPEITTEIVNDTIDDILAGPERIDNYMSPQKKELTAYHEAGHAIVGTMLENYDDVQRVSIIPRISGANGLTWFLPKEEELDAGMYTYQYLKNNIAVSLGGRIAEELIYGMDGVTTGASSDLRQVTNIARQVIRVFAMGEGVVPMNLEPHVESGFVRAYSEDVQKRLDQQVEKLVRDAYDIASDIILKNADKMDTLVEVLMENEVVEGDELRALLFDGKRPDSKPRKRPSPPPKPMQSEANSVVKGEGGEATIALEGDKPGVGSKEDQVKKMVDAIKDAMETLTRL